MFALLISSPVGEAAAGTQVWKIPARAKEAPWLFSGSGEQTVVIFGALGYDQMHLPSLHTHARSQAQEHGA